MRGPSAPWLQRGTAWSPPRYWPGASAFSSVARSGTCRCRNSGSAAWSSRSGPNRALFKTDRTGPRPQDGWRRCLSWPRPAPASPCCTNSPPTSKPTASGNASAPMATRASPTTFPPPACLMPRGKNSVPPPLTCAHGPDPARLPRAGLMVTPLSCSSRARRFPSGAVPAFLPH